MKTEEIIATLEEATGSEPHSLSLSSSLSEVIGWDSMGKLELLAMVDERFDVRLPEGAIVSVKTVEDLCRAVSQAT